MCVQTFRKSDTFSLGVCGSMWMPKRVYVDRLADRGKNCFDDFEDYVFIWIYLHVICFKVLCIDD